MPNNTIEPEATITERGCGCCLGCLAGPVLLILGSLCLAYLIEWLDPKANFDGFVLFYLLGITSSGAGAFLGYIFAKPIVEFLKEIKWRIWDT